MATDRPYGDFYNFYNVIPEYFKHTLEGAEDVVCYNSADLFRQFYFFYKILELAHSYGNHGYLSKRGSALQCCIPENMPENYVPGFMTLFSLLDRGQVPCNYKPFGKQSADSER
jgi:hypothetical protein